MVFRGCSTDGNGAINIYGVTNTTFYNTRFTDFYAGSDGAAVIIGDCTRLNVLNCTFDNNRGTFFTLKRIFPPWELFIHQYCGEVQAYVSQT